MTRVVAAAQNNTHRGTYIATMPTVHWQLYGAEMAWQ